MSHAAGASGRASSRLVDGLWGVGWGALSILWCVTAALTLGPTFDEPTYLAAGLERWRHGGIGELMPLGTMPLPVDLQTLPLYVWERLRGVPFDIGTDGRGRVAAAADLHAILPVARLVTLLFWVALLYYAYRAGRELAGPWGGRLALALMAVEPSLLGHASLATTDLALTAAVVACAVHYAEEDRGGWWRRIGLPGLWFGLALLSKASALVLVPLCLVAIEWRRRDDAGETRRRDLGARLTRTLAATRARAGPVLGIGLLLAFVYCGSDWRREPSFVAWAATLPPGPVASVMTELADRLRIFSNAGEGLVQQVKHNVRGHGAYLLGRTYDQAVWFYFPVVLVIKLTLPVLAALAWLGLRHRAVLAGSWPLMAAAAILVASLGFRVQTGIRFVLPLVALLLVGLGAALAAVAARAAPGRRRRVAAATGAGLVSLCATAGLVWPHGLAFTNLAWGGTAGGYRHLSDSNYDWGQGLPELRAWHTRTGRPLAVWYWGTDPAFDRGPWDAARLHLEGHRTAADVTARVGDRYLAVGTTLVYGSVYAERGVVPTEVEPIRDTTQLVRRLLRATRPVDRTATFLIYDLRGE